MLQFFRAAPGEHSDRAARAAGAPYAERIDDARHRHRRRGGHRDGRGRLRRAARASTEQISNARHEHDRDHARREHAGAASAWAQGLEPASHRGRHRAICNARCTAVVAVAPCCTARARSSAASQQLAHADPRRRAAAITTIRDWPIDDGRLLHRGRRARRAQGRGASARPSPTALFPDGDPVGQHVQIRNVPFTSSACSRRKGQNR